MALPTGAMPSPAHLAFAAFPFQARADAPSSWGVVPKRLSTWGNTRYGICVTAEEAFAKVAYSTAAGVPDVFVTDKELIDWAWKRGYLHGASLTGPMDDMISDGVKAEDGKLYHDGPYHSVDWTKDDVLRSAIFTGPVKIGISSTQLQNIVSPGKSGWFLLGGRKEFGLDHCVGLCGYGTVAECAAMLGVTPPAGSNASERAYLLFTWGAIGVIDRPSLINITGEAWIRTPTTPEHKAPDINPDPLPGPPPPGPVPVPGGTITIDQATKTIIAPAGWRLVNQG